MAQRVSGYSRRGKWVSDYERAGNAGRPKASALERTRRGFVAPLRRSIARQFSHTAPAMGRRLSAVRARLARPPKADLDTRQALLDLEAGEVRLDGELLREEAEELRGLRHNLHIRAEGVAKLPAAKRELAANELRAEARMLDQRWRAHSDKRAAWVRQRQQVFGRRLQSG